MPYSSLVLFISLLLSLGCTKIVRPPEVNDSDGRPLTTVRIEEANSAWAEVLATYVNDKGWVDFESLKNSPDSLNLYLKFISLTSPDSTPDQFASQEDALAYYLNSYNALAMYNVLASKIPPSLSGLKKVKFFFLTKMIIGGEEISLYDYENNVIRPVGEERVHFALNCMSAGCPRLPQKPFSAANLDAALEREANYFFNEQRNLQVNKESKTVRVSEILKFFTEDFLAKEPSLISYINRYRNEAIPADYQLEFIPYDWTIVNQDHYPTIQ